MKLQSTNCKLQILLLLLLAVPVMGQVAAHAPTAVKKAASAPGSAGASSQQPADKSGGFKLGALSTLSAGEAGLKPVARVNGAVLTENDLLREMYAIFPYAQQHGGGFPKRMEAEIRQGALQMIIFEELLYQEAKRRNLKVPQAQLAHAEASFRKQFHGETGFQQYLKAEHKGSKQDFREKVRRSLLIERMLKTEVTEKSKVTLADAKAYYDKNPKQFTHGEIIHIQSISIIPPDESPNVLKEAHKRANDAFQQARKTTSYREFGLLAEKISDDDFHVNYGDHKPIESGRLPPPVVKAARAMKPGQVSELIQLGNNYTVFRLVAIVPAGKTPFDEVKDKLHKDMQKEKRENVRSALGDKLRKAAKIEIL